MAQVLPSQKLSAYDSYGLVQQCFWYDWVLWDAECFSQWFWQDLRALIASENYSWERPKRDDDN